MKGSIRLTPVWMLKIVAATINTTEFTWSCFAILKQDQFIAGILIVDYEQENLKVERIRAVWRNC